MAEQKYDDEISQQSSKALSPRERQHVRLLLELARVRARLISGARKWGAWIAGSLGGVAALVQILDWLSKSK